jgi:hypothetical protein
MKPHLKREKVGRNLLERLYQLVRKHPGLGRVALTKMLLAEDPRRAIFFYTNRAGTTLTLEDLSKIFSCSTPEAAAVMQSRLMKDREAEFKINYNLISTYKQRINRSNIGKDDPLFAAQGMGFKAASMLDADDAARLLRVRFRSLQCDEASNRVASSILSKKAVGALQKSVASSVSDYIKNGLHKINLKQLSDDVEKAFIRDIGKKAKK